MTTPVVPGAPLVAVLVDRSGSMSQCLDGMQDGLNDFIADQAALPTSAALMLGQFDHRYELLWKLRPIAGAPKYRLMPRGRTALYDAVGQFIGSINAALAEENTYRPVTVCIITDGASNADVEWTREAVQAWIETMRRDYGWTFVFLGANLDACKTGAAMGIPIENTLTFDTRNAETSYQLLHEHVTEVRAGKRAEFSNDARRRAIEQ